jgi:hypothetical protein
VNLGLSLALAGNAPEATATLRPLAEQPDAPMAVRHDLAVALAAEGKTDEAQKEMGHDLPMAEIKQAVEQYQALFEKPVPVAATAPITPVSSAIRTAEPANAPPTSSVPDSRAQAVATRTGGDSSSSSPSGSVTNKASPAAP